MAQKIAALQISRGAVAGCCQTHGDLKLLEGFFKQFHFLISKAQIVMSLKIPVAGCIIFALGSDTIFFEDLCQTGIDSDRILLAVWRRLYTLPDSRVSACNFGNGDNSGRWVLLFWLKEWVALKRKFQLTSLRLRWCAVKLLPPKIDVDVRAKLLFQQIQSVQRDVNIALSNIEIYALKFLSANGSVTRLRIRICV